MSINDSISNIFPVKLRDVFNNAQIQYDELQEIRLRCGQPLMLMYRGEEYFIGENGSMIKSEGLGCFDNKSRNAGDSVYLINSKEINETMEYVSRYSMYAFEEEIKQGYITVPGGHRVGICGKAVLEGGKIKTIRYISFINIRIAHEVKNCSNKLMSYIFENHNSFCNTLIISPPMNGKTTLLRDMIRNISNGFYTDKSKMGSFYQNNLVGGRGVGLADERSEIAASYMGVPQNDVGIRTDVLDAVPKTYGIMMLIRTMAPKVIAVDEIGSEKDIEAILYGVNCGCGFLATIHGESLEDIKNKTSIKKIMDERVFKRYIIIKKTDSGGRRAEIYNGEFKRIGCENIVGKDR